MAGVEQPALGGVERLATRLRTLPHDALAELAAQLCVGSAAALRSADEALAAHRPLPQWAVQGVLLSADLVPHVLAPLDAEDGAAAAVCSAWAVGWQATNEPRRRLREVPHRFPEDLLGHHAIAMAVLPGEEVRLVVATDSRKHIVDRSMRSVGSWPLADARAIAADEESIFHAVLRDGDAESIFRCSLDGEALARFEVEAGRGYDQLALAPGGLLFVMSYVYDDDEQDEILALDAQSLQLRYRFGLSLVKYANGMVVAGDELFVCDARHDRLEVFSLVGEHRRSIVGEWKRPMRICFCKDRLYMCESGDFDDYDEVEDELAEDVPRGHRIFVLSLQGETLQVFTHPDGMRFDTLCCFDGKLLASSRSGHPDCPGRHMMTLRGL